jgi:plasmid stabilization system protein ParE
MVREVIWSKRAWNNFNFIINYLEREWGESVTREFVKKVYYIIDLIEQNPELGKLELTGKRIRGFVVTKHNTLFYRIDKKGISILNLFDNRQGPAKRKY